MSTNALYTRWPDVPAEQLEPLLSRQFVTGSQAMVARIELKKGCIVPRHQHHNEQITHIIYGSMRFSQGEDGATADKVVHAGDIVVIPGNLPHSVEALEDCVVLDFFAPPRQDWLPSAD